MIARLYTGQACVQVTLCDSHPITAANSIEFGPGASDLIRSETLLKCKGVLLARSNVKSISHSLVVLVCIATCGAAHSQSAYNLGCSFNNGKIIRADIVEEGAKLRINWVDGVRMTYTRFNYDNPTLPNFRDSLGGYWYYTSHRTGLGFNLDNQENGNKIVCYE